MRYVQRMASRATPFGLFAGCTAGFIGETTSIDLKDSGEYKRHTGVDAYYLYTLRRRLISEPSVRNELLYYPNSSIYRCGAELRYVETTAPRPGDLFSQLVRVPASDELLAVLSAATKGTMPHDLAKILQRVAEGPSFEEAVAYVDELITAQLLVPKVGPSISGPVPLEGMVNALQSNPSMTSVATSLRSVATILASIDGDGLVTAPEAYASLDRAISAVQSGEHARDYLHVNLTVAAHHATVTSDLLDRVRRGAELLHALSFIPGAGPLRRFRTRFASRYGEREVRLVDALDGDVGVGFPDGGMDQEHVRFVGGFGPHTHLDVVPLPEGRQLARLRLIERAAESDAIEVALDDDDIRDLGPDVSLPAMRAFSARVSIGAPSGSCLSDRELFLTIDAVTGPSGIRSLARYAHFDKEIASLVSGHIQEEEALDPEAIFAEVVHYPEGRIGSVVSRPHLRAYEIPYLADSCLPLERQILVSDLMVSVIDDQIVLRSKRLNRRVNPRLSNAHNYRQSPSALYRFLCAVQDESDPVASHWTWGTLESSRFLPRVRYQEYVFSRARWHISASEIDALSDGRDGILYDRLRHWQARRHISRFVYLAENDHHLLLDFHNPLSIECCFSLLRRRQQGVLIEMLPTPEQLVVAGPGGHYVHELIVPFVTSTRDARTVHHRPLPAVTDGIHFPGSDWLYFKLYVGYASADTILTEVLAPFLQILRESRELASWFFVRYNDPDPHLRVRLKAFGRFGNGVLADLHDALSRPHVRHLVSRVDISTYEQELYRYGGPEGMAVVENIFAADSDAVIALLPVLRDISDDDRWRTCVVSVDKLLGDFGLTLPQKRGFLDCMRPASSRSRTKERAITLGAKYRAHKDEIGRLLSPVVDPRFAPIADVLNLRSERIIPQVGALSAYSQSHILQTDVHTILCSVVHLSVNRLVRSNQQSYEVILGDLLRRHYTSLLHRGSGGS